MGQKARLVVSTSKLLSYLSRKNTPQETMSTYTQAERGRERVRERKSERKRERERKGEREGAICIFLQTHYKGDVAIIRRMMQGPPTLSNSSPPSSPCSERLIWGERGGVVI